jgi:hypothetical protein
MPVFILRSQDSQGDWHLETLPDVKTKHDAERVAKARFNRGDRERLELYRKLRYDEGLGRLVTCFVVIGER